MKYQGYREHRKSRYQYISSGRIFYIRLSSIISILIVFFGILYVVIWSPLLRVTSFEITNDNLATPSSFVKTAVIAETLRSASWWKGIVGSDNILFWLFDLKHSVIAASYLKSIEVNSSLWKKDVQITIEERHAEGVWCAGSSECFVFDQDGIIFAKAPEVRGVLITKVNDESNRIITEHGSALPHKQWFANILSTLDILEKAGMTAKRVTLRDTNLREWEAVTSENLTFHFSLNFIPDNLSRILNDVNDRLPVSSIEYLDFRVPNRLYYR